jgi:hypothetical protein
LEVAEQLLQGQHLFLHQLLLDAGDLTQGAIVAKLLDNLQFSIRKAFSEGRKLYSL